MLENPPKEASFDHIDADGNLIFMCENTPLLIQVDDTLERAIAESHHITRKNSDERDATEANTNSAQTTATLPISQIQALIRAGISPSHVAQRYNVSEAQVRRFSAGVETEKQYAIEQFLLVPAPKQSNMRTLADLIERTLAKAHIGMETVQWHATRRGLEPWRITATFKTATRTIKAEWTWNMHDNSVSCANPSSRLLLGEDTNSADASKQAAYGGAYRDTVSINFPFNTEELPGNSIRSARIERAVSQWELRNSDNLAELKANDSEETSQSQSDLVNRAQNDSEVNFSNDSSNSKNSKSSNNNYKAENLQQSELVSTGEMLETQAPSVLAESSESQTAQKSLSDQVRKVEEVDNTSLTTENASNNQTATANKQNENEKSATDHSKRRSGRAAVPSWDEILFGEG